MPKPVSFTHSGLLPAPIDRVFALLRDPSRFPEWLPGCHEVAPRDQPMKKGAVYHLEIADHNYRVEIEIVDFNPPNTLGWVELRRRTGNKVYIALHYEGGVTNFTMKHIWHPSGWRAWLNGQFYRRRDAWRTFNRALQNLRKILTK